MKFAIILLAIFTVFFITTKAQVTLNKPEANSMYVLLNKIRANPKAYAKNYKLNLSLPFTKRALIKDTNLQKAAEAKALDMANRQYFSHINPDGVGMNFLINKAGYALPEKYYTPISTNYFESIGAGYENGKATLQALIIDSLVPNKAHRNHLLGIGDFNKTLIHVGIGFVNCLDSNCNFQTYCCILIARP
jgi:hypothetical protein